MSFWGIEVKPGKPFTHSLGKDRRRLHISQATLGTGTYTNKSLVQCNVGNKSPVLLCVLLPEKNESCHLDLEFDEVDEVIFSVIGPRSVHLTGYYLGEAHRHTTVDDDSYPSAYIIVASFSCLG
ncbi:Peptidyl-prolyl cis-trans isomerase fkbp43 [Dionaea muscipula]